MEVTSNHLDKFVVVLQENFLLLRWRRNVSRCFGMWLTGRLTRVNKVNWTFSLIDVIVREKSPGIWTWEKGGKNRYNREAFRIKIMIANLDAAKDCVTRWCKSTWWDWVGCSRLFFWRWPEDCWLSSWDGHADFVKGKKL